MRSVRETDEVSQAELARALGVSRQFLSSVEIGKSHVGLDFAKRVADVLGYSPEPFAEVHIAELIAKAGIKWNIELKPKRVA